MPVRARTDRDQASARCELNRIRQEIIKDCADLVLIRVHNNILDFEFQLDICRFQRQALGTCDRNDLCA